MPAIVQEIGAAVGLTAAVGLVVLSVLYIAQAREVKRLREWAGRTSERSRRGVIAVPGRAAGVPPPSEPRYSPIGTRHVAVVLAGLLLLGGAAVYGVTQLTGGHRRDDSGNAQANNASRVPSRTNRNGAAVKPGEVAVAVLNSTTVPGLAAALSNQIAAAGYKKGPIDVFADQQLTESVVQYARGHEAAAKAVSRRLGISQLEPVTATSRALAGHAMVIVIAGADHAP